MNTARNSSAPKGGCMRSCGVCLCVSNSCPPQIENAADGNFRPMEVTAFTGCGKPCKRRTHSRPCPYVPPDSAFRDDPATLRLQGLQVSCQHAEYHNSVTYGRRRTTTACCGYGAAYWTHAAQAKIRTTNQYVPSPQSNPQAMAAGCSASLAFGASTRASTTIAPTMIT